MKEFDLIIKNGKIVDGTGEKEPFAADMGIIGGTIAKIGTIGDADAEKIIDAEGLFVTPGFIDFHSHGDSSLLFGSDAYNQLEQGITTEMCGQCGSSPVPYCTANEYGYDVKNISSEQLEYIRELWRDYRSVFAGLEKQGLGTNVGLVAAHGEIRKHVMGYSPEKPTAEQLGKMCEWVRQGMECGCFGLSTGLIYPPGVYGDTDEIIELAKVVAEYGGFYVSHIRGESFKLLSAVEECICVGETCGITSVISHHKVCNQKNAGLSAVTLKMIDEANARGTRVRADQYPFLACSTGLISSLPPSYATDGIKVLVERLNDPEFREKAKKALSIDSEEYENMFMAASPEGSLIVGAPKTKEYIGKTIAEVAILMGCDEIDAAIDLLILNRGVVDMAFFLICEEDMMRIIAHPCVMPGTDWMHNEHQDREQVGGSHPRGTATFIRHLRIVRENNIMPVHKAIYRATGLPAETAGLSQGGLCCRYMYS